MYARPIVITDADRIENAFVKLREQGYIARGGPDGFLCCQNCAGTQIANDVDAMTPEERSKVRGAVFYHQQDAEAFTDGGTLFISFGPIECGAGTIGEDIQIVGNALAAGLRAAGLEIIWDDSPDTRIGIPLGPRRGRWTPDEDCP